MTKVIATRKNNAEKIQNSTWQKSCSYSWIEKTKKYRV